MFSLLFCSILLTDPQPAVDVQTLAGPTVSGRLVEVAPGRLTVAAGDVRSSLRWEELQGLTVSRPETPPAAPADVLVELVDGSRIVAREYTAKKDRAEAILADGQTFALATQDVANVRLQRQSEAAAAEWRHILESKPASDLLVIRKGDSLDYHKGVLSDVAESDVQFEIEGDKLPVKRAKVAGLVYYHPPGRKLAEAAGRLTDVTSSQWTISSLALADGLHWTTPAGVKMSRPLAQVQRIDFASDRIVYLSDLKPDETRWTPYFQLEKDVPTLAEYYAPRSDRELPRGSLQLGGRTYGKGLALHTRTELRYRLPDRFRRFKAIVGIDDQFRPRGTVRVIVRGDDRVLFEQRITGTDEPLPVDLDLTDVRRLSIVVDFAGGLDVGNHLLLCEARLIK